MYLSPIAMASSDSSSPSGGQQAFADPPLLRSLLAAIAKPFFMKNPTAVAAMDLVRSHDNGPLCYDHFGFRTFGVDGCGIDSIAQVFLDMGYERRGELHYPQKKLRAFWFSPPDRLFEIKGHEFDGPLPRIFVSELQVSQLPNDAQEVINKYIRNCPHISKHAGLASVMDALPWPTPSLSDYQALARESEYAAWTLVNGYALHHLTVSVHRLRSNLRQISILNDLLQSKGIKLNSDVSPDNLLLQSSTTADSFSFCFAGNEWKSIPASYMEFAERLVLPQFSHLPEHEVHEWHRRDGFEAGGDDNISESIVAI